MCVVFEDAMPQIVVFNIVIPRTDDRTGIVHAPKKFRDWVLSTATRFGGISTIGVNLRGLWFDPTVAGATDPVEDHNNWYKVGVAPHRVDELRDYVRASAIAFGQKCLYFERAGEAELVWAHEHDATRRRD